ncbi:MAG: hypothetical protein JXB62_16595 [Pirellulales bacterium]|nr:hypothetical protein [Pirellulales bacterium]
MSRRNIIGFVVVFVFFSGTPNPGPATASTYWQHDPATPGDWLDPGNWTAGVPQADQSLARIDNGGTARIDDGLAFGGQRLLLGTERDTSGSVELDGAGQLSAVLEYIGYSGSGRLVQTGGVHLVSGGLVLGRNDQSQGTYQLAGTGQLTAEVEYVGVHEGQGQFEQTGGVNTAGFLSIGASGQYALEGATLEIGHGLYVQGILRLAGSPATIRAGDHTLVHLGGADLRDAGQASLEVGANSLTIFAAGFDPDVVFGAFSTGGLIHTAGTELVVAPGEGFAGSGLIDDHVRCEGTIAAGAGGGLDLRGGVTVVDGGSVDLGSALSDAWDNLGHPFRPVPVGGVLVVNDPVSGISGGELFADEARVGYYGTGRFTQAGGTHTVRGWLAIGYALRVGEADGTYELQSGQLTANKLTVGDADGTGRFVQSGGVNTVVGEARIGTNLASSLGTYELSGDGQLHAGDLFVGHSRATGEFVQSGGANAITRNLYVGEDEGHGTYRLSGGELSSVNQYVGYHRGTGLFVHTGGANTIDRVLSVAGGYELGDTAALSAGAEYIGGSFGQSGGQHDVGYLSIEQHGEYSLTGGTLAIGAGLNLLGRLDFGGSPATMDVGDGRIVNFSGAVAGGSQVSFQVGVNSLTILAPGFDPHAAFASFTAAGMVHTAGTELVVPSGEGFAGAGVIADHVRCEGTIGAPAAAGITLAGGLTLSGQGDVDLGVDMGEKWPYAGGTLIVCDVDSQMSSGRLVATDELIGFRCADGRFVQVGGSNTIGNALYVAHGEYGESERPSHGRYELGGSAELLAANQHIGYDESSGEFDQTGGSNTITEGLYVGDHDAQGTYRLTAGVVSAAHEHVGHRDGSGTFIQSDGTNSIGGDLYVGDNDGEGIYYLHGGQLAAANESVSHDGGDGVFVQTGGLNATGVLTVGGSYSISAGTLAANELRLEGGTLDVADAAAEILVADRLSLGPGSILNAAAGASIHMTGSAFENESTDPAALAGLSNLALLFEGGPTDVDPLEVAGSDLGAVLAGFEENFALATLRLGGSDVGMVRLVDSFDNLPGVEALYVRNLDVGPGCYLDLNGLNLYYLYGGIDPAATVAGGRPTLVPEPCTWALLLAAALCVAAGTWRRRGQPLG